MSWYKNVVVQKCRGAKMSYTKISFILKYRRKLEIKCQKLKMQLFVYNYDICLCGIIVFRHFCFSTFGYFRRFVFRCFSSAVFLHHDIFLTTFLFFDIITMTFLFVVFVLFLVPKILKENLSCEYVCVSIFGYICLFLNELGRYT